MADKVWSQGLGKRTPECRGLEGVSLLWVSTLARWFWVGLSQPEWTGIAAVGSLAAVTVALVSVRQSQRALLESNRQNEHLRKALVKPVVRVSLRPRAFDAIEAQKGYAPNPRAPKVDCRVALTNIGLGRALNVVVTEPEGDCGYWGDGRFLVSPDDFLVLELRRSGVSLSTAQNRISLAVDYTDVLGHKYRYRCNIQCDGDGTCRFVSDETDEDVAK